MKTSKVVTFILTLTFFVNSSFAATGFKEVLQEYQYAVTVEWNQRDQNFLKLQEEKLLDGIEENLKAGHSPEELLEEAVLLIPDLRLRAEIKQSMQLYKNNEVSKEQMLQIINFHSDSMAEQGASWSTVTKVLIGVVLAYGVFKALLLVMYYWDTDPHSGHSGVPPKV